MQPCLLIPPNIPVAPNPQRRIQLQRSPRKCLHWSHAGRSRGIASDRSHSATQPAPLPCDCAFARSALPFLPFSSSRSVIYFFFFCSSYLSTHQPQSVFFLGPQRGRGVSSNRKLWKAATPLWHLALSHSHCRRARRNEGKKFLTFEWNVPTVVGHFLLETFHKHSSFVLSDSLTSVYSLLCKQRGNGFTWKTFNSSQNPFLFVSF